MVITAVDNQAEEGPRDPHFQGGGGISGPFWAMLGLDVRSPHLEGSPDRCRRGGRKTSVDEPVQAVGSPCRCQSWVFGDTEIGWTCGWEVGTGP